MRRSSASRRARSSASPRACSCAVTEPERSTRSRERIAAAPRRPARLARAIATTRDPERDGERRAAGASRDAGAFAHVRGRGAALQHRLRRAQHGHQPAHRRVPAGARPAPPSTSQRPTSPCASTVVQGEAYVSRRDGSRAWAGCRSARPGGRRAALGGHRLAGGDVAHACGAARSSSACTSRAARRPATASERLVARDRRAPRAHRRPRPHLRRALRRPAERDLARRARPTCACCSTGGS